jgi:hypothetical protein
MNGGGFLPVLKYEFEHKPEARWRKQDAKGESLSGKRHSRQLFTSWYPRVSFAKKRIELTHAFLHKSRKAYVGLVEREFSRLSTEWKETTRHWSSVTKMVAHADYLRIIGLAAISKQEVERLLLQELRNEPDHWFAALTAISGEDPASPECDFDQSVDAWLKWGEERGII